MTEPAPKHFAAASAASCVTTSATTDSPEVDPAGATFLRDHFCNLVLSSSPDDFSENVFRIVHALPLGSRWTGEAIRLKCQELGVTPRHYNAWGAAIKYCIAGGLLTETGRFPRMRTRLSHARRNPEYERT